MSPGGTYYSDIHLSCGGTANTAVWISRLGGKSQFFGKVGNDYFGNIFKSNLNTEKVVDLTAISKNHETGKCVCLVDDAGERTMIVYRGANDDITRMDVQHSLEKIKRSTKIYINCYCLLNPDVFKSVQYLLDQLENVEVWFNPGSSEIIELVDINYLVKTYGDALVLNIREAKKLSGCERISNVLNYLTKLVPLSFLTLANKGSIAVRNSEKIWVPACNTAKIVDSTGAGDAFSAGIIVGLEKSLDLREALVLANKVASRVITRYGAR